MFWSHVPRANVREQRTQPVDGQTGAYPIEPTPLDRMLTRASHAYFPRLSGGSRDNLRSRVQPLCRQPTITSSCQASGKSDPAAENRAHDKPVAGHFRYTGCRMPA